MEEVDRLNVARRATPDPELDQRLLSVRHRAGLAMVGQDQPGGEPPAPDLKRFQNGAGVPEVQRDELSPAVLRGAMLSRGCLLVRGMVDPSRASEFRDEIERALAARDAAQAGEPSADGYFDEFVADERYQLGAHRAMVSDPSGMWVADSPRVAAELFDLLEGRVRRSGPWLPGRPASDLGQQVHAAPCEG